MTDLILAIAHHLAVFTLVLLLAIEFTLVRPGLSAAAMARLSRIDGAYGLVAGLVLVFGFLRVFFGASGPDYYWTNWVFWTKVALFIAVGLASLPPTIRFISWSRALKADPAFVPADAEVIAVRRLLHIELGLLFLIPAFAAAMARGYGL
jgi:putative membrane protein